MKVVTYVFPLLHKFRVPFHELVRSKLREHDILYQVIYSEPPQSEKSRLDTAELIWGIKTAAFHIGRPFLKFVYQAALVRSLQSDLVIMQQENKLLLNYVIRLLSNFFAVKVAFFGHGRNFQAENRNSFSEKLKRFMATKVDWWFAYNDLSAEILVSYGVSPRKITSVQNSIDISALRSEIESISTAQLEARRRDVGLKGKNIGIYIGGLYKEKKISFLIDVAKLIRAQVPDFELVVIGGGADAEIVVQAAKECNFIRFMGAQHGREKTETALLSSVFLLPGAVGLAVLDAFAYGVPLITTAESFHGPEIDYLKSGVNGVIVESAGDPSAYAGAVIDLLKNEEMRLRLSIGARSASKRYSIEAMANRFVDGIISALACDEQTG